MLDFSAFLMSLPPPPATLVAPPPPSPPPPPPPPPPLLPHTTPPPTGGWWCDRIAHRRHPNMNSSPGWRPSSTRTLTSLPSGKRTHKRALGGAPTGTAAWSFGMVHVSSLCVVCSYLVDCSKAHYCHEFVLSSNGYWGKSPE